MPRIRKTDANQLDIMKRLRQAGFKVASTHIVGKGFPDMVVGGNHLKHGCAYLVLVEVKQGKWQLTEQEEAFFLTFRGMPVIIADRPSTIARAFGWTEQDASQLDDGLGPF